MVFANNAKRAKHIFIDHSRLPHYMNLHKSDMNALRKAGLIQPEAPVEVPKMRIDYPALAKEYRKKLGNGDFESRSDLARSIGMSRAWTWRVMNRLRHYS